MTTHKYSILNLRTQRKRLETKHPSVAQNALSYFRRLTTQ